MPMTINSPDPVSKELAAIRRTLQDLLIIEAAQAGIGKAEVRTIAGVDNARVTRIWKHIRSVPPKDKAARALNQR